MSEIKNGIEEKPSLRYVVARIVIASASLGVTLALVNLILYAVGSSVLATFVASVAIAIAWPTVGKWPWNRIARDHDV